MRVELHTHTHENDICARLDAADMIAAYHTSGYDGVVITNHFFDLSLEWYKDDLAGYSHEGIIDFYLRGYRNAVRAGENLGVVVLLGLELRFDGTINDYLVYGIDESFLYSSPLLNTLTLDTFLDILPADALVYQAHPFRDGMTVTNPSKLYGVEVHNGGTSADRNAFAKLWAEKYGLAEISGSDFHSLEHLAKGGVIFENMVRTESDLVTQLKSGRYSLITD